MKKFKEAQEKEQDGLQEEKIIMCEVLHGTGASKKSPREHCTEIINNL